MTKIEAIRKTIYNLENDVYKYQWMDVNSCNCGILARTITGQIPHESGFAGNGHRDSNGVVCNGFSGVFKMNVDVCSQTGTPLPVVYAALLDTGFTPGEMKELENCAMNKAGVLRFLRIWEENLSKVEPKKLYKDITRELSVLPEDKIETGIVVKVNSFS